MTTALLLPLLLGAAQAAQPSVAPAPAPSCTEQWRRHGHTNQKDAAEFGRRCLVGEGAIDRQLTRSEITDLLQRMIPDDHALAQLVPTDIAVFCPNYAELTAPGRAAFWRALVGAMIDHESDRQAIGPYWEEDQGQFSLGLLQLSFADEPIYHCGLSREAELADPAVNARCGIKILTANLQSRPIPTPRIGGSLSDKWHYAAKYWSVLRDRSGEVTPKGAPVRNARANIAGATSVLPVCARRGHAGPGPTS